MEHLYSHIPQHYDRLLDILKATIIKFYGEDPETSTDYSRIISEAACKRLKVGHIIYYKL